LAVWLILMRLKKSKNSSNREKIIKAALELFNEFGTAKVSTNHICEKLSISPGNLYYHYRNKDEIIIAIFEEMINKWDQTPVPKEANLKNLTHLYERTFQYLWDYRFIHREINFLYQSNKIFKEIFRKAQNKRLKQIEEFISKYLKAGIFKVISNVEIRYLARTIWFFSLYWMSYLETEGKPINEKSLKESISILSNIIKPYLSKGDLK